MSTADWIMALVGVLIVGLGVGYRLGRWTTLDGLSFTAEKWRLRALHAQQQAAALEEQAAALEKQADLARATLDMLLEDKLR
jgi:hypothetical protein